jgi:hypothetical protein
MISLTPEQRQAVEQAGAEPVRLTDPESNDAYYLLKAEVFERVRDVIQPKPVADLEIPESIRRSKEAFLRDLPSLLGDGKLARLWVAYHSDERIAVGHSQRELIRECLRRGLKEDEYYVGMVVPHAPEPEQIDPSFFEFEDVRPTL